MEITGEDAVLAAWCDSIVEDLPLPAIWDLLFIATSAEEVFVGIQAQIQLKEVVYDYYSQEDHPLIKEDPRYPEGPDGAASETKT